MGQPVTPRSRKLQLTISQSHHFSNKKNLSNHSVLHFFSVNPRVWSLGSAPYDGYFLFTHLWLAELAPLPSQISTFWSWWISCMVFHSALHLIPQAMDVYHGEFWKRFEINEAYVYLWTLKHDRMFQRGGCDGLWTKMEQGYWGDVVLVSALIKERFLCYCMSQYMYTTQLATSPPKWSIAKASQICKNPIPSHVSNRNINSIKSSWVHPE